MKNVVVTRKGEGRKFALEDGTAVELAQVDDPWTTLEVMAESDLLEALIYRLEPGATSGEMAAHGGQEVHIVIEGEVEYTVGGEKFTLKTGDVLWHRSEDEHIVKNAGESPAIVYLVNLPPCFKW